MRSVADTTTSMARSKSHSKTTNWLLKPSSCSIILKENTKHCSLLRNRLTHLKHKIMDVHKTSYIFLVLVFFCFLNSCGPFTGEKFNHCLNGPQPFTIPNLMTILNPKDTFNL